MDEKLSRQLAMALINAESAADVREVLSNEEAVRVTSAISAVDRGRVVVTTSSGRQYELAGPPEEREIEREMLRAGAVRLGMGRAVDVSVLAWECVDLD